MIASIAIGALCMFAFVGIICVSVWGTFEVMDRVMRGPWDV